MLISGDRRGNLVKKAWLVSNGKVEPVVGTNKAKTLARALDKFNAALHYDDLPYKLADLKPKRMELIE